MMRFKLELRRAHSFATAWDGIPLEHTFRVKTLSQDRGRFWDSPTVMFSFQTRAWQRIVNDYRRKVYNQLWFNQ